MPPYPIPAKRAQWRARLGRFAQSQSTVAAFCREEDVSVASFYAWRRKLSADEPSQPRPAASTFVPVRVTPGGGLRATLPNGAQLELTAEDHELVKLSIESIARAPTAPGGA